MNGPKIFHADVFDILVLGNTAAGRVDSGAIHQDIETVVVFPCADQDISPFALAGDVMTHGNRSRPCGAQQIIVNGAYVGGENMRALSQEQGNGCGTDTRCRPSHNRDATF